MLQDKKLITIVVPVYNEAANLNELYNSICIHIKKLPYEFELIFIDDASTDNSLAVINHIAQNDGRVTIIQLSRNFGKEAALSAGLHSSKGDATITIDADMQMPPSLIGPFIERWRDGAEVVVGVFSKRSMGHLRVIGAKVFYQIMSTISHTKITPHATDYRLLDRQVVDIFNNLSEHNRITRGLIDWMGFRRSYVHFDQIPRLHGKPTYSLRKLINLAINSFTAFSLIPLKLCGYLGSTILIISIPVGLAMYIDKFVLKTSFGISIRGTAFIAVLILFLVGVVLACLGLISIYIAHIYDEVIGRPLYIVRRKSEPLPPPLEKEDGTT